MASKTSKRTRMKCRACRRRNYKRTGRDVPVRFTLKEGAEHVCPMCSSTDVVSDEHNRRKELAKQDTCRCSGVAFRHRKGSHKMCHHYEGELTEEEERDAWYDMMNAERSQWD